MSKTANAGAIGARRAWLGVGAPVIALVAMIIALAVFAFWSVARDQDQGFERNSSRLVSSGLEGRARMMGAVGLDYANWDAAFENVSVRWNQRWIDASFYSSVADQMVLFRQSGAVLRCTKTGAHPIDIQLLRVLECCKYHRKVSLW